MNYDIISYNYYKTHNPPPQKHSVTGVVLYAKTVRKPYFKRFLGIEKVHRNFDRNRARGCNFGSEGGANLDLRGQCHLKTVFSPEKLRQNGSCLFQHSKRNAPIQFPESGLVAVVLKSRVRFCISQPIIFCMLMR